MEPRVFTRGNKSEYDLNDQALEASMEPRVFTRGNLVTPAFSAPPKSFNGATRLYAWKPSRRKVFSSWMASLQWSHASLRVETIALDAAGFNPLGRFNGATRL